MADLRVLGFADLTPSRPVQIGYIIKNYFIKLGKDDSFH